MMRLPPLVASTKRMRSSYRTCSSTCRSSAVRLPRVFSWSSPRISIICAAPSRFTSARSPDSGSGMSPKWIAAQLVRLVEIMATLRGPGGCPWDREQTIDTLKPFELEDAYEVLEAIDHHD